MPLPLGPSTATTVPPGSTARSTPSSALMAAEYATRAASMLSTSGRAPWRSLQRSSRPPAVRAAMTARPRARRRARLRGSGSPRPASRGTGRLQRAARPLGAREEHRRAELAECDRERETRGGAEARPRGEGRPRARHGRARPRGRPRRPGVEDRSTRSAGATMRTTNGAATSDWATGTSHHDDRKSTAVCRRRSGTRTRASPPRLRAGAARAVCAPGGRPRQREPREASDGERDHVATAGEASE